MKTLNDILINKINKLAKDSYLTDSQIATLCMMKANQIKRLRDGQNINTTTASRILDVCCRNWQEYFK